MHAISKGLISLTSRQDAAVSAQLTSNASRFYTGHVHPLSLPGNVTSRSPPWNDFTSADRGDETRYEAMVTAAIGTVKRVDVGLDATGT